MTFKSLFIHPIEGRLRMVWRIALTTLINTILTFILSFAMGLVGMVILLLGGAPLDPQSLTASLTSSPVILTLGGIASLIAIVTSIWIAARFFDRGSLKDFGLQLDGQWWRDLAFGLILGIVLMALIFAVEYFAGWVSITGTFVSGGTAPFGLAILLYGVLFLCVGIYEEVLSRGYYLTTGAQGLTNTFKDPVIGLFVAFFISSAVFGLMHAANPNATLISTINIVLAGLFLLGVGYVLTGRLGISIGVHITWNFFQGNVFGFPVSGMGGMPSFIAIQQAGDPLITGGPFGPEAGLIGVGAMILGTVLTFLYVRWQYGGVKLALAITEPPQKAAELPAPEEGISAASEG